MIDIHILPALSDNYIYLWHDASAGVTAVVDPGEAGPVLELLATRGWHLTHILNTHHHGDHIGGNADLMARYHPTLIGPRAEGERIEGMTATYGEGDRFTLGGQQVRVFETPGHTRGHIAFHLEPAAILFSGDTLFSLGCGRLFEGTPAQMWDSLLKLRALPDETMVYCGHEYTEANLRFALSIDPDNPALGLAADHIRTLRARGQPSLPARLGSEKRANPFLRADDADLAARLAMAGAPPADLFAEIRRRKDQFRG